jgi:hypothetical protein
MASILKVDALQGIASAGDITVTSEGGTATQSLQQGLAKAWFFLQHDSAPAIGDVKDSLNFASITDEGTGQVSYTFTNSFNSVYHLTLASYTADQTSGGTASTDLNFGDVDATRAPRTNGSRIRLVNGTGGQTDAGDVAGAADFGDLA